MDDQISVNVLNGHLHFMLLSGVYGINTARTHCRVSQNVQINIGS